MIFAATLRMHNINLNKYIYNMANCLNFKKKYGNVIVQQHNETCNGMNEKKKKTKITV